MASFGSSHLKDIDERFCQCSICLQQYREPKQLPCLHRYCRDCLKQLIEQNEGAMMLTCPECRDQFKIPREGVSGFKTDFYMQNIIEYIEIQKSLENEQQRECYGCSKQVKITSYCFKCNGYLCKECHEFHMTNKFLKDHKQHVLSLEDVKSKHMTLENLADLAEAPRCQSHPGDLCRLCCRSCDNLPICMTCTYGSHKNHDINDVGIIAAEKREKLKHELNNLNHYREQILKLPETVDRLKGDLVFNVREKKEKLTIRYERDMEKVKNKIKKREDYYSICQNEIEEEEKTKLIESKKQMEIEMKELKMKYDNICDEIIEECRIKLDNLKHEQEEENKKSREKLAVLEKECNTFIKTLETKQDEGQKKVQEISQQIDDVIERYENLTSTGYSVLKTRDDWTAVHCIPDISKAIEYLGKDMKSKFPELDILSKAEVSPEITEERESPAKIEGFQTNDWRITGITDGGDGSSIVITGRTSEHYQSHITVINMKGKVLYKTELENTLLWSFRYCAYLSKFEVATTSTPNEIGVFDIRDYSYFTKSIRDVVSSWPIRRYVTCITTDPVKKHILVGGNQSRDVYVFDDQLHFQHIVKLPKKINYPFDMTINKGSLLICDRESKGAYIVNTHGMEDKLIHEFTKPDMEMDDWNPLNVCTDANGFIYILWMTGCNFSLGKRVVTQYSQDGRQLLTAKQIHASDARCIAIVRMGMKEKLLVATWKYGKIYIYSIS